MLQRFILKGAPPKKNPTTFAVAMRPLDIVDRKIMRFSLTVRRRSYLPSSFWLLVFSTATNQFEVHHFGMMIRDGVRLSLPTESTLSDDFFFFVWKNTTIFFNAKKLNLIDVYAFSVFIFDHLFFYIYPLTFLIIIFYLFNF